MATKKASNGVPRPTSSGASFDIECPKCGAEVMTITKLRTRIKTRCQEPGCRVTFTVMTVTDHAMGMVEVRSFMTQADLKKNGESLAGASMDSLTLAEVRTYLGEHERAVRDLVSSMEDELSSLQKYHAARTRKAEAEAEARRRLDAEAKAATEAAARKVKVTDSSTDKDGGLSKDTLAYRGQALFMLRKWVDLGKTTGEQAKVLIVKSQTLTGLNELCDFLKIPRWD